MESLILPYKSKPPPLTIPFKPKHDFSSESPQKTSLKTSSLSLTNKSTSSIPVSATTTDAHLLHLCKTGRLNEAVDAFTARGTKVRPNTYLQLLQLCIDFDSLQLGRKVHDRIDLVDEVDLFVETKLIGMYAKCGCLEGARNVFDNMSVRNLYAWSAMIGACSREQRWREVLELFCLMMGDGFVPDEFLFPKVLQACGNCGDLEVGKVLHSFVIRSGMSCYERVNNSVLAVYVKCGKLSFATKVFETMVGRDRVAWNSMISGYCKRGEMDNARRLFHRMQKEGIEPGLVTWNILIAGYSKSGSCDIAIELMKNMESSLINPDVFTWTSVISGLTQNSRTIQALELFREMVSAGVEPSGVTVTSVISACASLKALTIGKELHLLAVRTGLIRDILVRNALIDMYSKCSDLAAASRVFDLVLERDTYTWNSMIGGYCDAGYCGKAYNLFMKMRESDVSPNVVTWNVMISGYMHNGDEDQAMDLFEQMEKDGIERDTASWNSLIAGYVQNGYKNKALGVFRQMQISKVVPNSVTILSILPACANLVAVKKVKEIHAYVIRSDLDSALYVSNSLIDAFAKSGRIDYSKIIFDGLSLKDVITWNSLIGGYVLHGCSHSALDQYSQMIKAGIKPNRGTFLSIISAHSLARKVGEGKQLFSSMIDDYQILPGSEHYLAMIELFGRSGRLEEAFDFIEEITIEPDSSIWDAFITACRIQGNIDLVIRARKHLLVLYPGKSRDFLETIDLGKMKDTERIIGQSWIEINNTVHRFVAGDCSKPYSDLLYSWIQNIGEKVKPSNSHHGICTDEEEGEEISGVHSEKFALAFALISSPCSPKSIRIIKDLRMCKDCHRTAKLVTVMYSCEIYIRDSKCFHHFKNGTCSCGDYW